MNILLISALGVLTLTTGCNIFDPVVCTLELRFTITATATDSINGDPVVAGLSGSMRDGDFEAPLVVRENTLFYAGPERPGNYTVTISANGYVEWTQTNVRVVMEESGCHVIPAALQARMRKTSSP